MARAVKTSALMKQRRVFIDNGPHGWSTVLSLPSFPNSVLKPCNTSPSTQPPVPYASCTCMGRLATRDSATAPCLSHHSELDLCVPPPRVLIERYAPCFSF